VLREKDILLSVITVVFNGERHIAQAIESVLATKSSSIEYLVIDGASTDSTLNIVMSYGQKISKVVSEPDLGLYDAMNKGLRLSQGQYVLFLNADDYHVAGALEKVIAKLETSNPDVLYCDLDYVNEYGAIKRHWCPGSFQILKLKKLWISPHPTTSIKRDLLMDLQGFDIRYRLASDYDLLLRVFLRSKKIVYLDNLLVKMRLGGVTNSSFKNIILQNIEIFDSYKRHFDRYPTYYLMAKVKNRLLQMLKAWLS
jgi:glycosyltransferase involved in cell wall biosynthesis